MSNIARQTQYFLKKHTAFTKDIDKYIIKFFIKADSYMNNKEKRAEELQLKEIITKYVATHGEQGLLMYFDMKNWLDNQLTS